MIIKLSVAGLLFVALTFFVKIQAEPVWPLADSKEEELALLRSRNQAMIQYIQQTIAQYDTIIPDTTVAMAP